MKGIFLDFYGTVVHEDDDILPVIYERVQAAARVECTTAEIGDFWWKAFSEMFYASHGSQFTTQRVLNVQSLTATLLHFQADGIAELLNQEQLAHWQIRGYLKIPFPFCNR